VDAALVASIIDRDWDDFESACRRLRIGTPIRSDAVISVYCTPTGADEPYLAVVACDDYDAQAPLLDFGDPAGSDDAGRHWWPRMGSAPMNNVTLNGRHVPIMCVPGTRGTTSIQATAVSNILAARGVSR
jgi:hypothetical protein